MQHAGARGLGGADPASWAPSQAGAGQSTQGEVFCIHPGGEELSLTGVPNGKSEVFSF